MALSTNPASIITASAATSSAVNASSNVAATAESITANINKAKLALSVNNLSGVIGSGLNGATNAINNATASINALSTRTVSNLNNAVQTSLTAQSTALFSSLTTEVGSKLSAISQQLASGTLSGSEINAAFAKASADIVQATRSLNLPSVDINSLLTGMASNFDWGSPATVVRAVTTDPGDWRVQIDASVFGKIIFPVLPNMTLSHKAEYNSTNLVHSNYSFMSYKNSSVDDITISCEWPVETHEDAEEWLDMVKLGRSLTKMFYGISANLGNPPLICTLKGYSGGYPATLLPDTPVVVKSFTVDLKDDVNYIAHAGVNYVPRLSNVSITVGVVYNRNSQRGFNFDDYRSGTGIIKY